MEHLWSVTCNFRGYKFDQKRTRGDFKIYGPYNINTVHVVCTNKSDNSKNKGKPNHLKIILNILSNIHEKHGIKDLQTTAILGTTYICIVEGTMISMKHFSW